MGAPKSLARASIHPRRYATHIALASSICEPSNSLEEVRCDALMEDDVWVDPKIVASTKFQMADSGEF